MTNIDWYFLMLSIVPIAIFSYLSMSEKEEWLAQHSTARNLLRGLYGLGAGIVIVSIGANIGNIVTHIAAQWPRYVIIAALISICLGALHVRRNLLQKTCRTVVVCLFGGMFANSFVEGGIIQGWLPEASSSWFWVAVLALGVMYLIKELRKTLTWWPIQHKPKGWIGVLLSKVTNWAENVFPADADNLGWGPRPDPPTGAERAVAIWVNFLLNLALLAGVFALFIALFPAAWRASVFWSIVGIGCVLYAWEKWMNSET